MYFYWPETARLSLEEIGQKFGDEVAVHINDATDEEKRKLDQQLEDANLVRRMDHQGIQEADGNDKGCGAVQTEQKIES